MKVRKLVDMPWHKDHPAEEVPQIPGAPAKRTPIKGIAPTVCILYRRNFRHFQHIL